jgi:amidase
LVELTGYLLQHLDCDNNITGRTFNPHNIRLSPGGSSGGESASIGFRCAAIGVASDIGGSIRLPAAFCGSYGIRPTTLRTPWNGVGLAGEGQEAIRCTLGPIANSLRDLDLFMTAVTDGKPWEEETRLVPLPWKELTATRDFTVGVLWDDGMVHPHPPIQRAMKMAVAKMKAAGIKTVDWQPYKHEHGMRIINDLFYPDGAAVQIAALESSGEPWLPLTKEAFIRARNMTVPETWMVNSERETYRSEHRLLMKKHNVDFILCPSYVGVAAEPHEARYFAYTAIWNVLDMPGVVFPTGLKVDQKLDVIENGYQPRSAEDEVEYKSYSPEKFVDAPIALQLVGLPAMLFLRASANTASLHSRWATGFATNKPSLQLRCLKKLSGHEY